MTTKVLKSLSEITDTIEIIRDSGIAGTANMDPCCYPGAVEENEIDIHIVLSEAEDDDDEEDDELDIDMIWLYRR